MPFLLLDLTLLFWFFYVKQLEHLFLLFVYACKIVCLISKFILHNASFSWFFFYDILYR